MGQPTRSYVLVPPHEFIVREELTWGSETSQYPEERKSNETPKVAASEMGRAQTEWFRPFGVVGPAYAILE